MNVSGIAVLTALIITITTANNNIIVIITIILIKNSNNNILFLKKEKKRFFACCPKVTLVETGFEPGTFEFPGVYQSLERSKSRRSKSRDLSSLTATPHP